MAYELTRAAIRRALATGASVPSDETSATLDALVTYGEAQRREIAGANVDLAEVNGACGLHGPQHAVITHPLDIINGDIWKLQRFS